MEENFHIGEKYNHLTIKEKAPDHVQPSGQIKRMVKCECDCEKHTILTCMLSNVLRGNTKSCGCQKIDSLIKTKSVDITGKRFGKLIAIKREGSYFSGGNSCALWKCKCDCGELTYVPTSNLLQGLTKSCGCLAQEHLKDFGEKYGKNRIKDLTNQRFGKLIALYRSELVNENGQYVWHCRCDCGNEIDVVNGNLQSGCTQSCGCLKSKGEAEISILLTNWGIKFKREKKFKECKDKKCLAFDFYLPDYNMCIEFQGEQHYMPVVFRTKRTNEAKRKAICMFGKQIKRDNIKREHCKENNIKLLEIPYWDKENIDEILVKELGTPIMTEEEFLSKI